MSRTSPPRPNPSPMMGPAEPDVPPLAPSATERIESILRAPERRAAVALEAATPVLETLRAREGAVRRRLQAQQVEHGAALNMLANRDYRKLHVLLGGALAMTLKEQVEATRGIFEGRLRGSGTELIPSVYATLDRVLRLIQQVTAKDLHRCPPRPPGCGCLIAQIITFIEDAEAMPTEVTKGMANIRDLEHRIVAALKARGVDGTEEMAPVVPSAPPPAPRSSGQARTSFNPLEV